MTDQIKTKSKEIWNKIDSVTKIVLNLHIGSDPDSMGSAISLALVLKKLGKQVTVVSEDEPSIKFRHLSGFELIHIVDYSNFDWKNYDLFISTDTGAPNQLSRKPIQFPLPIPTIKIDHHKSGIDFGEINLIEPNFISASEIVYLLINEKDSGLIDKDIATWVFAGMWADSGGFIFENTSAETYRIAAKLVDKGVNFTNLIFRMNSASIKDLKMLGYGLSNIKTYFNNKVAVTQLPYPAIVELGFDSKTIGRGYDLISFQMSSIEDKYIIAVIHEKEPQKIGFSLRSNHPQYFYDVSAIAKQLGGGGHARAAGAKLQKLTTIEQAEKLLLQIIQQTYPDLGQP